MAGTGVITVRAEAKYVGISARKARVVLDHIRGRSVPEARTILSFTPRVAARDIEKVLASAVANAEANHGLDGANLVLEAAYADEGPTLKRWRARARGRVNRIRKRSCHITLIVREADSAKRQRKQAAVAPAAAEGSTPTSESKPKSGRRSPAKKKKEAVA